MAVGLDFLSKTKLGGMKDIMAPKTGAAGNLGNTGGTSSIFGHMTAAAEKSKQDVGNMNTSDLIKYVYQNNGGDVNIQDNSGEKSGFLMYSYTSSLSFCNCFPISFDNNNDCVVCLCSSLVW